MASQLSAREFEELIRAVSHGAEPSDGSEHRRSPRVSYSGRIEIVPYTEQGPRTPMLVTVQNFSPCGICIQSPAFLQRGKVFVARLPRGQETINLLYTVVHCTIRASRQHVIGAELMCVLRPGGPGDHSDATTDVSSGQVKTLRDSILG